MIEQEVYHETSTMATIEHPGNVGPWRFMFTFILPLHEAGTLNELSNRFSGIVSKTTAGFQYDPMRSIKVEDVQNALVCTIQDLTKDLSMHTVGVTAVNGNGSRVGLLTTQVRKYGR